MEFYKLIDDLHIDKTTVMERFSGNQQLLERFILKFRADSSYQVLMAAYEEQKWEDVEQYVHTLKGISSNLGFDYFSGNCAEVLQNLRAGNVEAAKIEFHMLEEEYQRIIKCIDDYNRS